MKNKIISRLIPAFLFVILPALLYASQVFPGAQTLRREIQILHSTRQLAASEAEKGNQSDRDGSSILRYIDYLDSRIAGLCAELSKRAGMAATAGLGCPPPGGFLPGFQAPAARTSQEQVEDLDGRLREELGRFDDMLSVEQEKIASKRRTPSSSQGGTGSAGAAAGDEGTASGTGSKGPSQQGQQGQQVGNESRETGEGTAQAEGRNAGTSRKQEQPAGREKDTGQVREGKGSRRGIETPPPPPISKDDDIVARQLREAAERETDPQLREKLWEEYRKYKESRR